MLKSLLTPSWLLIGSLLTRAYLLIALAGTALALVKSRSYPFVVEASRFTEERGRPCI